MKTFAALLLAYPFYLAVHGRLVPYVSLAKPKQGSPLANGANAAATTAALGSGAAQAVESLIGTLP